MNLVPGWYSPKAFPSVHLPMLVFPLLRCQSLRIRGWREQRQHKRKIPLVFPWIPYVDQGSANFEKCGTI